MRDLGNAFDVSNVQFWITDGLRVNQLLFSALSLSEKRQDHSGFDEPDDNPQRLKRAVK